MINQFVDLGGVGGNQMSGLETKRRRFQIGDPVINLSNHHNI